MDQAFLDYIDGIRSIERADELERQAAVYLEGLGFDAFTYVGFNPPGSNPQAAVASTYPRDWVQHYNEHRYILIDPTVIAARQSFTSITFEDGDNGDGLTKVQKRVHDEARDFGIRHAVTVPIHGPCNDFAFFSARSAGSIREWALQTHHFGHYLRLVGMNFHSTFIDRILGGHKKDVVQLSKRETECLLWTARGKSSWEISQILSISNRTVEKHLASASAKFGVSQKTPAVVRAIMDGCIAP